MGNFARLKDLGEIRAENSFCHHTMILRLYHCVLGNSAQSCLSVHTATNWNYWRGLDGPWTNLVLETGPEEPELLKNYSSTLDTKSERMCHRLPISPLRDLQFIHLWAGWLWQPNIVLGNYRYLSWLTRSNLISFTNGWRPLKQAASDNHK